MANLAFELGFNWDVPPIIGVRDGVFPLQLVLVNDDDSAVISPCDSSVLTKGDELRFRVYDFTDPTTYPSPARPLPNVLQILFTSAGSGPLSPILVGQPPIQLPHLAAVSFVDDPPPTPSIAYIIGTSSVPGWDVLWQGLAPQPQDLMNLAQAGRFKFRALLTAGIPGEMTRFYPVDPEMVIGHGGP